MEKQRIIRLDLDEMHVSTENPRIKIVIDEIQAIHEIIFEQGDKIIGLIKSIIEDEWIIGDLPAVYIEDGKYIVYEGNRRISALKCFFDPELLPHKNKTSERFKKYISTFSKEDIREFRLRFKEIPVTLHSSKELIYKYMEKRHTPNNGKGDTLERWNTVSNERFKNEIIGKKSLVYSVYNEFIDLFKKIEMEQFPMSTLERVLKNPTVKEKMKFDFKNDILTVVDKNVFERYLRRIIDDINKKEIDSRKLSKSEKISNYIINIEGKYPKTNDNNINPKCNNVKEQQLDNQMNIDETLENGKKDNSNTKQEHFMLGNKKTKINTHRDFAFSRIEAKTVDVDKQENVGLLQIIEELKEISKTNDYKKYPISTAMLVRNLLEQSLKYQLIKLKEWEKLVLQEKIKNKNNKEPGLESIINYCNGNAKRIFPNSIDIQRAFMSFASNKGTKDYLDMIVHHPECVRANYTILENITDSGLYSIIYYILNN